MEGCERCCSFFSLFFFPFPSFFLPKAFLSLLLFNLLSPFPSFFLSLSFSLSLFLSFSLSLFLSFSLSLFLSFSLSLFLSFSLSLFLSLSLSFFVAETENQLDLKAGDLVEVNEKESSFVSLSLSLYLFPPFLSFLSLTFPPRFSFYIIIIITIIFYFYSTERNGPI